MTPDAASEPAAMALSTLRSVALDAASETVFCFSTMAANMERMTAPAITMKIQLNCTSTAAFLPGRGSVLPLRYDDMVPLAFEAELDGFRPRRDAENVRVGGDGIDGE